MNKKAVTLTFCLIGIFLIAIFIYYKYKYSLGIINLKELGSRCKVHARCGDLVGVDCGSAVDGPYFYVEKDSGAIVSRCGGYCMGNKCTDCPPKEWTCSQ